MNDNKFDILRTIKDKYKSFGYESSKKRNPRVTSSSKVSAEKMKICGRIRNKRQSKSQFPKLTKSSKIFNGGRRKKTKKRKY